MSAEEEPTRLISAKLVKLIFALGFFAAIAFHFSPSPAPVTNVSPVKAAPYIWPEGCTKKIYEYYEEISAKCMDDRYLLANEYAESLGADTRSRRGRWPSYRVGNDIFGIDEHSEKFEVRRIKRNVFYQGE